MSELYRNSLSRERSDRFDRSDRGSDRFERRDDRDRNQLQVTKRSFSREKEERSRDREQRGPADPVRRVASMTDDRDSRERARSRENGSLPEITLAYNIKYLKLKLKNLFTILNKEIRQQETRLEKKKSFSDTWAHHHTSINLENSFCKS